MASISNTRATGINMSDAEEIEPFLVCRSSGTEMECAVWTVQGDHKAIALFLTEDAALSFREGSGLPVEWKPFRPGRCDLLQILTQSHASGVRYAVLDPLLERARRIFDLEQILKNAAESGG